MSDIKRISPAEAHTLMAEGYTYLDVRSEQEFDAGHPAGAVNIPLSHMTASGMQPNDDFLAVVKANFAPDAKLVLGCKAGGRSLKAAGILVAAGFTDVIDQRAGWEAAKDAFGAVTEPGWSKAGLPTDTGAPEGRGYVDMKKKA